MSAMQSRRHAHTEMARPLQIAFVVGLCLVGCSIGLLVMGRRLVTTCDSLRGPSRVLLVVGALVGLGLSWVPLPVDFDASAGVTVRFSGMPIPTTMVLESQAGRHFAGAFGLVGIGLNCLFGAGAAQSFLYVLRRRVLRSQTPA